MKIIRTANYEKMASQDYIYLVQDPSDGSVNVYNYKENNDSGSVRFGLMDNMFIDSVNSIEEAKIKYPNAEVGTHKLKADPMSSFAPSDFDPGYAGERWDDDY